MRDELTLIHLLTHFFTESLTHFICIKYHNTEADEAVTSFHLFEHPKMVNCCSISLMPTQVALYSSL